MTALVFGPILFFSLLYVAGFIYRRRRRLAEGVYHDGTWYPIRPAGAMPMPQESQYPPIPGEAHQRIPLAVNQLQAPVLPTYHESHATVRRISGDSEPDDFVRMNQTRLIASGSHGARETSGATVGRKLSVESFSSGAWSVRRVSAGGAEDTIEVQNAGVQEKQDHKHAVAPQEVLQSPLPESTQRLAMRNKKGLSLISITSQVSQQPHPYSNAGLSSEEKLGNYFGCGLPQTISSTRPVTEGREAVVIDKDRLSVAPQITDQIDQTPFAGWAGFTAGNSNDAPRSAPEKRAAWSMILEAAALKPGESRAGSNSDDDESNLLRRGLSTAPLMIRKRSGKDT